MESVFPMVDPVVLRESFIELIVNRRDIIADCIKVSKYVYKVYDFIKMSCSSHPPLPEMFLNISKPEL